MLSAGRPVRSRRPRMFVDAVVASELLGKPHPIVTLLLSDRVCLLPIHQPPWPEPKRLEFLKEALPEYPNAFSAIASRRVDGIMVLDDPVTVPNAGLIVELATAHRLPSIAIPPAVLARARVIE
jgi:hypothetical protein